MNNLIVLTLNELHLIQMIIQKGPDIIGLEEFALSEQNRPGIKERDGLVKKGLLIQGEDGKYDIDYMAGHIFSVLSTTNACLRGQLRWQDGKAARYNVYLVDTEFVVVYLGDAKQIEILWIPTIQLLIGTMITMIRQHAEFAGKTVLSDDAFAAPIAAAARDRMLDARSHSIHASFIACFETAGSLPGWEGKQYTIAVDDQNALYYAADDENLKPATMVEAMRPINQKLLEAHINAIKQSGEIENE